MNRYILFIALMTGLLLAMSPKGTFGDVSANDQNSDVSITITKFQVNDQTLELSWKIVNHSDHDVWICDSVGFGYRFEVYMATDDQTLMIRKRFEVPTAILYYVLPDSEYVRLRPDEERTESVSLTVPVQQDFVFTVGVGTAKRATRLILEVGFYDEDLPGLIRSILEEAEKIAGPTPNLDDHNISIIARYFEGLLIARYFGDLAGFEEYYYKDPSEQLRMPYMHQTLGSEQVLRATIDGVSIPYGEVSSADEPPQSETEPAGVTMALTGLDVNDQTLELRWKIKNESDHEVWICDSMKVLGVRDFDSYIAKDAKTLVIRKRSDLRIEGIIESPINSQYIRLRPGQERSFYLSESLPFYTQSLLEAEVADDPHTFRHAGRIALEIGFYDEDLRGLILKIVELAEKLKCDTTIDLNFNDMEILYPYFGGIWIGSTFNRNAEIREILNETGDEFILPLIGHILKAEKTLRITVDGVSIPSR